MTANPRRGAVWIASLYKTRSIIVLIRNPMGRYLKAVLVAPVNSAVRGVSTEVPVGPADGIGIESVANLDHAQLVARDRLQRRVGRPTPGP